MSAINYQKQLIKAMSHKMQTLLHERASLPREELEYIAEKLVGMKDERFKNAVAGLIGWGDKERSELETFVAISLQLMGAVRPSVLREAARNVEIRYRVKLMEEANE